MATTPLTTEGLHLRMEHMAQATDEESVQAVPWYARLYNYDDALAEVGYVQTHAKDADPSPEVEDLFGTAAAATANQIARSTTIAIGDLVVVETQIEGAQPDRCLLVAYILLRSMVTLRASAVHFTWETIPFDVADLVEAQDWSQGASIRLVSANDKQHEIVDTMMSTHRGLRLLPPA